MHPVKFTNTISVRVLIQEEKQNNDKENKESYFCDAGPSRARGQAGMGNLKHARSRLCCPSLHSSLPPTSWHVCNQRWRQGTISPHLSPYKETDSVSPLQRKRDERTHLVEQHGKENLENQQYNPCNQASICGSALHKWRRVLERENDETE